MTDRTSDVANDFQDQSEDACGLDGTDGPVTHEEGDDHGSVREIEATLIEPDHHVPERQPNSLTQYLEKKFSFVEAANILLPVWRELVFNTSLFFSEIKRSRNLRIRAALYFCWMSSLCAVAFFVAVCMLHNRLFEPTEETALGGSPDLFNMILMEVTTFAIFVLIAVASSVIVWLGILATWTRVRFKPILVAGLYAYVFIMTIGVLIDTPGRLFLGAALPFGYVDAYDRLQHLTNPNWLLQSYLVGGAIWSQFVVPIFTTIAVSYASGVRPRRILVGGMVLGLYVMVSFYASALTLVYLGVL